MNPELIGIIILAPILGILIYKNLFNSNNSTDSITNSITDSITDSITRPIGPPRFWRNGQRIFGGKSIKNKLIKNKSKNKKNK